MILAAIFATRYDRQGGRGTPKGDAGGATPSYKLPEPFWDRATTDPVAVFTGVLAIATLALFVVSAVQIYFLTKADKTARISADAAKQSAEGAMLQVKVMAAVEGPIPVIVSIKLVQYTEIPGETVLVDPVLGGQIPANCRILFLIENKGRTPLRLLELCIEKFSGLTLPALPVYIHQEPWESILEKGPNWIRATDELANVTPADVEAAASAYPEGAFWVFGYFAYLDLLDKRIEYKFLARWDLAVGFVTDSRLIYT